MFQICSVHNFFVVVKIAVGARQRLEFHLKFFAAEGTYILILFDARWLFAA